MSAQFSRCHQYTYAHICMKKRIYHPSCESWLRLGERSHAHGSDDENGTTVERQSLRRAARADARESAQKCQRAISAGRSPRRRHLQLQPFASPLSKTLMDGLCQRRLRRPSKICCLRKLAGRRYTVARTEGIQLRPPAACAARLFGKCEMLSVNVESHSEMCGGKLPQFSYLLT